MAKPLRITLIILGSLVALLLVVVIGFCIYMRTTYSTYFEESRDEFTIPALNEGFVPQDLDYLDVADCWLFSGYMEASTPSPIFKQLEDGRFVPIYVTMADGTSYYGHGSAITSNDHYVFLTCEGGYLVLDAEEVASAEEGATLKSLGRVRMDFSPAFMNIEQGVLYLGNFYHPGAYETPLEHRITTPSGEENPAIMYAYYPSPEGDYGFAPQAEMVFSIPARVQGVCLPTAETIVFSTSYGLASSHLLAYDMKALTQQGMFWADGRQAPLYVFDAQNLIENIEAPPMTEGIEYHEGRIFVSCESASNKYIFGKLIGGGQVYSIAL